MSEQEAPQVDLLETEDESAREVYVYETIVAARRRLEQADWQGGDEGLVTGAIEHLPDEVLSRVQAGADFREVFGAMLVGLREANRLVQSGKRMDPKVRWRSLARFVIDMHFIGEAIGRYDEDPFAYLARRRTTLAAARGVDEAEVDALVEARAQARAAQDWAKADEVRAQLDALGVEVHDGPSGSTWSL